MVDIREHHEDASSATDAAVLWWVDSLRNPDRNSGEDNPNLVRILKEARYAADIPTDAQLELFANTLAEQVNELLEAGGAIVNEFGVDLTVSHRPSLYLFRAGREAGFSIRTTVWQWEIQMIVKKGEVTVRDLRHDVTEVVWRDSSSG